MVQHDFDKSRAQRTHHLHFFLRAEIAHGTGLDGIASEGNVGEDSLRGIFGGLPGCSLIGAIHQPEQRLTVERHSGVFGVDGEDEHAGAGSGLVDGGRVHPRTGVIEDAAALRCRGREQPAQERRGAEQASTNLAYSGATPGHNNAAKQCGIVSMRGQTWRHTSGRGESVFAVGAVGGTPAGRPLDSRRDGGATIRCWVRPIVRPDSDFSTLVLPALSPYNPLKNRKYLRSQEGVRVEARSHFPKNAQKNSGPVLRIVDFSARAGLWQLSERVYLPAAAGFVGGDAAFGVSGLQASRSPSTTICRWSAGCFFAAAAGTAKRGFRRAICSSNC